MDFLGQKHCILALFLILTAWSSQLMSRDLQEASLIERHEQWMAKHGKVYIQGFCRGDETFPNIQEQRGVIESFNAAGDKTYKLSINKFADQTNQEFKASRNGYKRSHGLKTTTKTSFKYENVSAIPAAMDWRNKGAVTPIKDQGRCGSGWAFLTVAATEGFHQLTTGNLMSLSEQELVDCDTKGMGQGCEGGLMAYGFEFVKQNGGITSEANYPYKAADGACNTKKESSPMAQIKGHEDVPAKSEAALLKAVAKQPVSVAIDAGGSAFQFYSGVLAGECGTDLDHGVTAVGYGTAGDGTKYWLVKNSRGTEWGEEGYIRMKRDIEDMEGLCRIAMEASYPTAKIYIVL